MKLEAKSNIANKVRNTILPRTKPMMPLFEVISNSIHAIDEAKEQGQLSNLGRIKIEIIRNGDKETLSSIEDIDKYPIKGFIITDNGIGLNDDNLNSFVEADTDHKIKLGGKGVGRFICLKAFKKLIIKSRFLRENNKVSREFEFLSTREGFHEYKESTNEDNKVLGTQIELVGFKEEYKKYASNFLIDVAREIVFHFQLYFISNNVPVITIENQNNTLIELSKLFKTEFKSDIQHHDFKVAGNDLKLCLSKSYKAQSHKIHFCAHHRSVIEEGLSAKLVHLQVQKEENPSPFLGPIRGPFFC